MISSLHSKYNVVIVFYYFHQVICWTTTYFALIQNQDYVMYRSRHRFIPDLLSLVRVDLVLGLSSTDIRDPDSDIISAGYFVGGKLFRSGNYTLFELFLLPAHYPRGVKCFAGFNLLPFSADLMNNSKHFLQAKISYQT